MDQQNTEKKASKDSTQKASDNKSLDNFESIMSSEDNLAPKEIVISEAGSAKLSNRVNYKLKKVNSVIESALMSWKDILFSSAIGRIILMAIIFIIITIPTLLMVLGFDNYFFRSTVKGTIYTEQKELISDAEITIQGKKTKTDKDGFFVLEDLDYGKWEVSIKANGFVEYKDEIIIGRFINQKNFELISLDFGVLTGTFDTEEDFIPKDAELFINDQKIKLTTEGTFDSGRLITGDYKLKFSSPYYKDFEKDIEIKSGNHKIDNLELQRAGDIKTIIVDFLTQRPLEGFEIVLEGTDKKIQIIKSTNKEIANEGFKVVDIDLNSEVKIIVKKENYKDKELKIIVKQGENLIEKIGLVSNGRFMNYYNGSIVEADLDGEKRTNLTYEIGNPTFITEENGLIYFRANKSIYSVSRDGNLSLLYSNLSSVDSFVLGRGVIRYEIVDNKNVLKFYTDSEQKILFESETESIISTVVDNGKKYLYFSTSASVYKVLLDGSSGAEKLTDGIFYIQSINPSDNLIITINYSSPTGGSGNLWTIKDNGERNKITVYQDKFSNISFQNDTTLVYLKEVNGVRSLFTRQTNSFEDKKLFAGASNYFYNKSSNLFGIESGSKYYLMNISGESAEVLYK